MVIVSWNDATAFCEWLSKKEGQAYHLPTEAQWEYTCRAGTTGRWSVPGDDEGLLKSYAWYANKGGGNTRSVGQKKANQFGLFDMHGNVREWCWDRNSFNYYSHSALLDPTGPLTGLNRILRGGAIAYASDSARSAKRSWGLPSLCRDFRTGFRVAMTIDPAKLKTAQALPTDPDRTAAHGCWASAARFLP